MTKLSFVSVRVGGGGTVEDMCYEKRETTSRGLCGLVYPSRTSERGGEGDCVKGGGGEEGECKRERAREVDFTTALDIEVDP
jgi:hypothetical protein